MITPEELADAACDDQAWKQIERRAAEECGATCFRDAVGILDGEIAKLLHAVWKRLVTKLRSVLGGIDLNDSCLFCATGRHSRRLSAVTSSLTVAPSEARLGVCR
jgi:hypothetical protein